MNARYTLAAVALFGYLSSAPSLVVAAEAYVVDPAHTSVVFSVSHAQLSYTYGFFRKASGQYILDQANPANCQFQFAIDVNSLDTNHAERDTHLRSQDFFNSQQFPQITFASTDCARASTRDGSIVYQVTGRLSIHGITRQVTIPLRMLGAGQGPNKDQRTGFLCQTELKRSEFGMSNLLDLVGDAVGVTISFEGVLQQSPASNISRPR
jgi:polyisoprenoid-binding protein YceI